MEQSLGSVQGWMVVYRAYSQPEAYIVAERLKVEGVPSFVHQEPAAAALGFTVGSLGEIKVLVSPYDYERAEQIVAQDYSDLIDSDDDEEDDEDLDELDSGDDE
jgi:hypothetical protein